MENFNFTPKQWVLVRDYESEKWGLAQYSHYDETKPTLKHRLSGGSSATWCIPFEGNEHLLGKMDDYVEPYVPKDGDFVYLRTESNTQYITIHHYTDNDGRVYNHVEIKLDVKYINLIPVNDSFLTWKNDCVEYRPATDSEKQQLLNALHKVGKDWDAEKKEIVELKWKPKGGDRYYYVSSVMDIHSFIWHGDSYDEFYYGVGNCFRTEAEAVAVANQFKKLLKEK